MSTIPKSDYKLEGNKMLVSLTLKVPIQFEIELRGQDTISQFNHEDLNTATNASSDLIINNINQAEIDQTAQLLSNQLASQILSHINESKLSDDLETLPENDISNTSFNSEDNLDNQQTISTTKKRKVRLADSLNDSLTLTANVVGAIFFLGKLANYSWE